jgi:hypothetical protein
MARNTRAVAIRCEVAFGHKWPFAGRIPGIKETLQFVCKDEIFNISKL